MAARGPVPDDAALLALLALPGMGPARLGRLLAESDPAVALDRVRAGDVPAEGDLASAWARAAAELDPAGLVAAHRAAGVVVLRPGEPGWPRRLEHDPEPPPVLLARGVPAVLELPSVAIVGTRRCSPTGRSVATELGHDLAAGGVCVLSGLALGIDAAAHEGALAAGGAPPAAVVGSGLDVPYPRRNASLWRRVGDAGVVVSEYPLGTRPERWRFPARNRIVAGLADVVVVVETRERGGSMHTVDAAVERGRPVLAVPGSVRNQAAAGTNALLAAGAAPVRDAGDVLVALGLEGAVPARPAPSPPPGGELGLVLDAVGWEPSTLEDVAGRVGEPLGPVAVHLVELERTGWVAARSGWYERVR